MESSVLFIMGSIYKIRAGGIMLITGNQEDPKPRIEGEPNLDGMINTTMEALRILIQSEKKQSN